ncbi:hypothetical protein KNO81_36115 [Paraburkholderia sediminicola]|nr:hypothetical protein [Paraburkholderia domus]MBK5052320.1 hypothetical protein [Burkholderia sp. R-70006]MBK5182155.1 hypothetical protein [Burkholderia sp. R-69749]MCI0151295.1 hypothetical protein [Paraburkholderia sediminicola]
MFSRRCAKVRDDGLANFKVNAELQQETMHLVAGLHPIAQVIHVHTGT